MSTRMDRQKCVAKFISLRRAYPIHPIRPITSTIINVSGQNIKCDKSVNPIFPFHDAKNVCHANEKPRWKRIFKPSTEPSAGRNAAKEVDKIMARHGENIYKRKDGRYEGRYISCASASISATISPPPGFPAVSVLSADSLSSFLVRTAL